MSKDKATMHNYIDYYNDLLNYCYASCWHNPYTEEREPMTRHEWNRYYNEINGNRTKSYEDCSWAELGYCLFCDFITNLI